MNLNITKMSKFPLYDNLSKNIPSKDLTNIQKKNFIKNHRKIDQEGCELVYGLIRMYQMENNEGNTSFNLPYKGKYTDNDITFDLNNFPITLRHILYKFLSIHLDKMKEEKTIEKSTLVKRF